MLIIPEGYDVEEPTNPWGVRLPAKIDLKLSASSNDFRQTQIDTDTTIGEGELWVIMGESGLSPLSCLIGLGIVKRFSKGAVDKVAVALIDVSEMSLCYPVVFPYVGPTQRFPLQKIWKADQLYPQDSKALILK